MPAFYGSGLLAYARTLVVCVTPTPHALDVARLLLPLAAHLVRILRFACARPSGDVVPARGSVHALCALCVYSAQSGCVHSGTFLALASGGGDPHWVHAGMRCGAPLPCVARRACVTVPRLYGLKTPRLRAPCGTSLSTLVGIRTCLAAHLVRLAARSCRTRVGRHFAEFVFLSVAVD